jgi:hypothetical protein
MSKKRAGQSWPKAGHDNREAEDRTLKSSVPTPRDHVGLVKEPQAALLA